MDYLSEYREHGFAILRGVFPQNEVAELADEAERIRADAEKHPISFRHQNILYLIQQDEGHAPLLRFVQWPSYFSPIMARFRTDGRLLEIVSPLIGKSLKQLINQLIWKQPRSSMTSYGYHQDSRFRRPASAFSDLANSYVQTAIAIDAHDGGNGGLKFVAGSHLLGELPLPVGKSVYEENDRIEDLIQVGLDPNRLVSVVMAPGDVVLWHPHTVHGSGPNLSERDRRLYLNGYIRAENSQRGEWAFRQGEPCLLGEPVLVQYEALYSRPEAHYLHGPPHPFSGE